MENISITQYKLYFIFEGALEYCSQIVSWKRFRYLHFETPLCKYISFPSVACHLNFTSLLRNEREREISTEQKVSANNQKGILWT